ncbi:MAG: GNAT family N-acetyltransferase [Paracoccaceae bacterium]
MDTAALVHRRARETSMPWLPRLHTPAQDRWFFRERVFASCTVRGAFEDERLVGFVAFRPGWVDHLYVLPGHQGAGLGSALLAAAKRDAARLDLWTFRRNRAARRFYEARGFVAVAETDGAGNEEREPDVLYRWTRDAV